MYLNRILCLHRLRQSSQLCLKDLNSFMGALVVSVDIFWLVVGTVVTIPTSKIFAFITVHSLIIIFDIIRGTHSFAFGIRNPKNVYLE